MRSRLSSACAMMLGTNVVPFALQLLLHGAPAHTHARGSHEHASSVLHSVMP